MFVVCLSGDFATLMKKMLKNEVSFTNAFPWPDFFVNIAACSDVA